MCPMPIAESRSGASVARLATGGTGHVPPYTPRQPFPLFCLPLRLPLPYLHVHVP